MALTATQIVTVAEIVQEEYDTVDALASSLITEQETSIITDLVTWALIRNSHVTLDGEVNFNNERKREAIRQRIRKMLGLPLKSYEVDGGYSQSVGHTWIY